MNRLLVALLMPTIVLAFAVYLTVGILTMQIPEGTAFPGPRVFPGLITGGLYLFAVVLAAEAVRAFRRMPAPAESPAAGEPAVASGGSAPASEGSAGSVPPAEGAGHMDWRSFAWLVGSVFVFALTLQYLGWIIAAGLLFWCVTRAFGSTRPVFSLVAGLAVSSATYIAFDMALGLPLPSGILGGGF
ncbi:tripartite tricarboxylate transporter TctB family protein [Brevibacterium samyangense]|uniref:DUF1468 domain-containing protein n=1 Tax=Brevibacterium samyangense TaxID=366888 RepID=A0ABN2TJX4_9MICO